MTQRTLLAAGSAVFACLAGFGCQSHGIPELSQTVLNNWSNKLGESGYVSVLPMTEDVRIGDVYAFPFNPEAQSETRSVLGGRGFTLRWAEAPVGDQLKAELASRPRMPATPIGDLIWRDSDRDWPGPDGGDDATREIGIGGLSSITFQGQSAISLIPTEAADLAPGMSWRDATAVTVRISDAESTGLSLAALLDSVVERQADGELLVAAPIREQLPMVSYGHTGNVYFRVVGEVVYLRSLDLAVSLDPTRAERRAERRNDVDDSLQSVNWARQMNNSLEENSIDLVPGSATKFLSMSPDTVALRRYFRRGLAFAVRGVTLEVEPATGKVVGIVPMGSERTHKQTAPQTPIS